MADADSKPSSRGKSVNRLSRLEPRAERIAERVLERSEPGEAIRLEDRQRDKAEAERSHQQDHVPDSTAAGPVGADKDANDHHRRAEVALQHQENQHAREHRRKRHEGLLKIADLRRVLVDPVGDEDREGELAELRRLECAERSRVEPAAGAIHSHAKLWDQDQDHQQRRRHRAGRRNGPQPLVFDAAQNEERDETDRHPNRLALRVIEGGLVLRVGKRDAGAGDHDQARTAQKDRGEKQQPVGLASRACCGAHAANRLRTMALNWLPRSP